MNIKLCGFVAAALSTAFLAGFAGSAMADSTDDIVNALVAKGVLTEEEGALLMRGRSGEKEAQENKQKSMASVEFGKAGLKVKSNDGDFSMKIGGRMHADWSNHKNDTLKGGKEAVDGTEIRRARLSLSGTAYHDFDYVIETDFAGNNTSLKDVNLMYHGIGPYEFTVGNQKQNMSMELEESSNDIMFIERSLVSALYLPAFDRAIGANLKASGDNWIVVGGVFGDSIANGVANKDEGHGWSVRGSFAPIMEENKLIHLGANYGYRKTNEGDTTLNGGSTAFGYRTTNLSQLRLVDAEIKGFDSMSLGLLEFAGMYGPASIQSEFAKGRVDRESKSNLDFTSYFAQVAYSLTGESRTYKGSDGEFKRLKPKNNFDFKKGTWGAWEIAARYDYVDLNDKDIKGGEQKRATLALNWYLDEDVRLMADYSRAFSLKDPVVTKADGSDPDDIDVFSVRAQWAF